ncbi:lipopolysaccharide assembly protein LapB [Kushneria phosphatilytica]|uniref:Lipopolysaccharide assembly protein B n=1 Tax=Kushneria phosphatilytica TaxID=657387 RepID=A0A1S1NW60_9GAMM|nr:lipopolysaccharide assembly protein LapB [Kushneria phosphatilytica]OHV12201.1 lipopolysaccharide assembly protein LapB [Kushneria phosphatilytica]QEL11393.1 lipopolysaccharide assembly protein LapB [Kushneria phosphatilytica]
MFDPLLLALLTAAIAIGWLLGRHERRHARPENQGPRTLSRDYFVGLNFLLNEQPDQAIETFTQALEVNSETIDTHIALGNLFRLRGEADRAVRIHQNLLARPALSTLQSDQVQLELARDFFHLGVLDRAERLARAVVENTANQEMRQAARRLLVDLFEREQEWQAALDIAQPQLIRQDERIQRAAAHWLCELAAIDIDQGSPSLARRHLKQALSIDEQCVRATWLLADIEHRAGRYRDEIRTLKRIRDQDSAFTPLILEPVRRAFELLDDQTGLISFLQEQIERAPFVTAIVMLAEQLRRQQGTEAAVALVSEQLEHHSSLRGIDYLTSLYIDQATTDNRSHLTLLKRHTGQLLDQRSRFRCHHCGLEADTLYWQCPRCRNWSSVKPITGLEGE